MALMVAKRLRPEYAHALKPCMVLALAWYALAQQAPLGDVFQTRGTPSVEDAFRRLYAAASRIVANPTAEQWQDNNPVWPSADRAQRDWPDAIGRASAKLTWAQKEWLVPCGAHLRTAIDDMERGYRIQISQRGNAPAQASAQGLYQRGRAEFAKCSPTPPGDVFQTRGEGPVSKPGDVFQSRGEGPGTRPGDVFQSGGNNRGPTNQNNNNRNNNNSNSNNNNNNNNNNNRRKPTTDDSGDGPCTLQKLAALVMNRYRTGLPIGVYDAVNSTSPTYLVTLQGVEWERRGQATMAGDAAVAWLNAQPIDAYLMAIKDAVLRAIPRKSADGQPPTIILAGHSLGGIEAQKVAVWLKQQGYKVARVISYGAPILGERVPGTQYLHVRAQDEPLQALDQRAVIDLTGSYDKPDTIVLSGRGKGNVWDPEGSHNNYDKDSSGLSGKAVPPVATLKTRCYEIDLKTVEQFPAPDLFNRATGGNGCLPPQLGQPKCMFRPKGLPAPSADPERGPMDRGMLLKDENFLKQVAAQKCVVILVRDSSEQALFWIGKQGYKPKPQDIKGKTLKQTDLTAIGIPPGMTARYLGLASARGMRPEDRLQLQKKGYRTVGAAELITDQAGNKFYSDTDLAGVYDANGKNSWSGDMLNILQCGTFDKGIQHGPHDDWPDRNDPAKAGANWGPQIGQGDGLDRPCKAPSPGQDRTPCKSITAIFPDGTTLKVRSLAELKQLYRAIGVNFSSVYPAF